MPIRVRHSFYENPDIRNACCFAIKQETTYILDLPVQSRQLINKLLGRLLVTFQKQSDKSFKRVTRFFTRAETNAATAASKILSLESVNADGAVWKPIRASGGAGPSNYPGPSATAQNSVPSISGGSGNLGGGGIVRTETRALESARDLVEGARHAADPLIEARRDVSLSQLWGKSTFKMRS